MTELSARDKLRQQVLSNVKDKFTSKELPLFGVTVELRTLSVKAVLAYQKVMEEDSSEALIKMLIDFVFIPGTDEHLFEEGDREILLNMPFDDDLMKFIDEANALIGIDLEVEVGNSDETQG